MKGDKDDFNRCRIIVTGDELVELKRHAHEILDCPDLDRQIQRHNGNKPLVVSRDELDWLVAVLDAVLHDPKGYPCVQHDPWKLEYVPRTDERCVACRRLHDRLNQESERLGELGRGRARFKPKPDLPKSQIEAALGKRGHCAVVRPMSRGYVVFDDDDRTIALIRKRKQRWEVLWWSRREKWESIGDMGGVIFDTVEDAAEYVLDNPMGPLEMTQMSTASGRRNAKTGKPLANPKPKRDLFGLATELAKVLNSKDTMEADRIMAMKKEIDIPKLEKAITRHRCNIALLSGILDELEAEIKEIKRNDRRKKPAKSKERK